MKDLLTLIKAHKDRPFFKVTHYIKIYERYFNSFRSKPINILEIGVFKGGSLQLWKAYFHEDSQIFGVDILPECKIFEEDRIKIFIGDQGNEQFLDDLIQQLPPIDIIIDDGGHTMQQQILTFEKYPALKSEAIYICEDCSSSYMVKYGGGRKKEGTFIEMMKDKIDELFRQTILTNGLKNTTFTDSTFGIHFYDSVVVIEKSPQVDPTLILKGGVLKSKDEHVKLSPKKLLELIQSSPLSLLKSINLDDQQLDKIAAIREKYHLVDLLTDTQPIAFDTTYLSFFEEAKKELTKEQLQRFEVLLNNILVNSNELFP